DIHMPDIDGFRFYKILSGNPEFKDCPFFFISSDNSETNRIKSFNSGAVDFITRDMTPEEVETRIKARIKKYRSPRKTIFAGNLRVDYDGMSASIDGVNLNLTFTEFKMLSFFLENFTEVISREKLVSSVWV